MSLLDVMSIRLNRTFVLRKLHQLSGIVPLGLFLLEHFYTNSKALAGQIDFNKAVVELQGIPYLLSPRFHSSRKTVLDCYVSQGLLDECRRKRKRWINRAKGRKKISRSWALISESTSPDKAMSQHGLASNRAPYNWSFLERFVLCGAKLFRRSC